MDHNGISREQRGGRDARNLASVPEDGELHAATKNIWPWQPCNYEAKRVILRSVYLEKPLRMAPVCVPSGPSPLKLVERCLGINECLGAAWEALKGQGVFITYD